MPAMRSAPRSSNRRSRQRGGTSSRLRIPRVLREAPRRLSQLTESASRDHKAWRDRQLALLENQASGPQSARQRVDAAELNLLAITALLAEDYGTPDLGNKDDPVDELVYIILSRRTREGAYQAAYDALKTTYASWEELVAAPAEEIERVIRFSGLGWRKAQSLKRALGVLVEQFGRCTLEPTRSWTDEETAEFLCTLPEIGPKSAACVMLCSLDRPTFPVDAHVGRVVERLGVFRQLGIELEGTDHKVKQRLLWDAVPPSLRYALHVNALVHGRLVCVPRRPRCTRCRLSSDCSFPDANSARV
jgi:endonuclease III